MDRWTRLLDRAPLSYLPAEGATFINNVISVLRDNPDVWRQTALILNYDECDGYFDHVTPPHAPCGDVIDHTSCIRFIERLTGVMEPTLSYWRRATVGDLVSAFDFRQPPAEFPDLPSPDALPTNNRGDANISAEESECFAQPGGSGNPPPGTARAALGSQVDAGGVAGVRARGPCGLHAMTHKS